jgi:hypothetical protein
MSMFIRTCLYGLAYIGPGGKSMIPDVGVAGGASTKVETLNGKNFDL